MIEFFLRGDWRFFWKESIADFSTFPLAWDSSLNTGIGKSQIGSLWIVSYLNFTSYFSKIGLDWNSINFFLWFLPSLFISFFSAFYLFRLIFPANKVFSLFSGVLYVLNTFFLMLLTGGQIGVGLAYSVAPIVVYAFVIAIDSIPINYDLRTREKNFLKSYILHLKSSLLAGLVLAFQVMFDARISYITMLAVFLYYLFFLARQVNYSINLVKLKDHGSCLAGRQVKFKATKSLKVFIANLFFIFGIPAGIAGLLHAFWIVPLLITRQNPVEQLGSFYTTAEAVRFLSFAKFENTISLLHPNWPENIFGKTYFMRPEFLILPILTYGSLLFVYKTKDLRLKTYVLYFAMLGLLGAFLAKGANEPFGEVYLWLFGHFPGMIMFRDPTKWYTLVAISYSMLIPFTSWKIYEWLKSQPKFQISNFKFQINSKNKILNFQNLFLLFIVFCLLYLIRPAILGQLTGTFRQAAIPTDYIKFKEFISSQDSFFRTLWVPRVQRFGFFSNLHPAVSASDFFRTTDYMMIARELKKIETKNLLEESAVKYVVVPFDSQGEIFLKDRKSNREIYQKTISEVKSVPYLKPVGGFGKIAVFELTSAKTHFYIISQDSATANQKITYKFISPVEYRVSLWNVKKGDILVFSEGYDAGWEAQTTNYKLQTTKFNNIFNSFVLPKDGNYTLRVYYTPQDYVNAGMAISSSTLVLVLGSLIYLRKKKI